MESGKKVVFKLLCKVCTQFEEKIKSRKNFSSKWIGGVDLVRISIDNKYTYLLSMELVTSVTTPITGAV